MMREDAERILAFQRAYDDAQRRLFPSGLIIDPGEHDAKRMLLNMITTSLYLGLPLLWSGMMAWAGMQVGRSITAASLPFTSPAEDAGRQGGGFLRSVASKGMKK